MKTSTYVLKGSKIILMGTKHSSITGEKYCSFKPEDSAEYKFLKKCNPDTIFVELTKYSKLKTHSNNYSDMAAIYSYSLNNSVNIIKYDKKSEKSYLSHALNLSDDSLEIINESRSDGRDFYRKKLKRESEEMFFDLYGEREDHGASVFLDKIKSNETIVIHCGLLHYNTYKRFFEFLSYSSNFLN